MTTTYMALAPPYRVNSRISPVDVHLLPGRQPLVALNMSPDPSRSQTPLRDAPGSSRLGLAVQRKKSTKELVAQFEAVTTPRNVASSSRTTASARVTSRTYITPRPGIPPITSPGAMAELTPPRRAGYSGGLSPPGQTHMHTAPAKYGKGKDRSPIRESFRNLIGLFKKGKSPNAKREVENEARRSVQPLGEMGMRAEKELPVIVGEKREDDGYFREKPLRSGHLYFLTRDRHWTRRLASLIPPKLYLASPDSSHASLITMSLEGLTSVHSLPRSSTLTLPALPPGEQSDEMYVFELEFDEGKRKEIFAVESVTGRAGWVSVFWDALLALQPGPSLPPDSSRSEDPFLSAQITGTFGQKGRQLRVMNGSVDNSPSSADMGSPAMTDGVDSKRTTIAGSALTGSPSRGMDIEDTPDALSRGSPRATPPQALPPTRRPLPLEPQQQVRHFLGTPAVEDEDAGASIIRFSSSVTRTTAQDSPRPLYDSPSLMSRRTTSREPPTSPPSADLERERTHNTIRIPTMRSPSPPLSRNSSCTDTETSTRSPSIQTLTRLSVVKLRLARLETTASPSNSPRQDRGDAELGARPSLNTPPLTIRKRPNGTHMLSPLPSLPVSSDEEEGNLFQEFPIRDLDAQDKPAAGSSSLLPPRPPQNDSHRESSSTSQSFFSLPRASQEAASPEAVGEGDVGEHVPQLSSPPISAEPSSLQSPHSAILLPPEIDFSPVLASLQPLGPQYAALSSVVQDVKEGLGHISVNIQKVLEDVSGLRTEVATAVRQDETRESATVPSDDQAWQHVRRQLSELIVLVTENMGRPGAQTTNGDEAQTMMNIGRAMNTEATGADADEGEPQNKAQDMDSNGFSLLMPSAKLDELVGYVAPLLEQQKHLQAQQVDTIRYLNELNPWLQKLAASAEKTDGVPKGLQQIADALGVSELRNEGNGPSGEEQGRIQQILVKLEQIREDAKLNYESPHVPAMDAVLAMLAQQREEQEKLLRTVAADLSNDIRGERLRFVDAMKEATSVNVQFHLEEFKKQLNHEVMRMTQDVSKLRDEKLQMEQAIGELFALKAKHGQQAQHQQQPKSQPRRASQMPQSMPGQVPQQYQQPQPHPPQPQPHPHPPHPHPPAPIAYMQSSRYPSAAMPGRLQMPRPLAGHTQQAHRPVSPSGGRPLPQVGPRFNPAGEPRATR